MMVEKQHGENLGKDLLPYLKEPFGSGSKMFWEETNYDGRTELPHITMKTLFKTTL